MELQSNEPDYVPPKGCVIYSSPTYERDDESGRQIREELEPQVKAILKKHNIDYVVHCMWENQNAYRYMLKTSTFHDVGVDRSRCIPQVYFNGQYKAHVPELIQLDANKMNIKSWMEDPDRRSPPVRNRWGEFEDKDSERLLAINLPDFPSAPEREC